MAHATITANTNRAIANIKRLANVSSSPFLRKLPAEMRNAIYDLAVADMELTNSIPGLVMVCSQIRNEALPIFFTENVFHLTIDVADLESGKSLNWLRAIASNHTRRFQ